MDRVRLETETALQQYVEAAHRLGLAADYRMEIGTEAVAVAEQLCLQVAQEFPRAVFFAGKLIFEREQVFQRLLHNETAYQLQRRLQFGGLNAMVLPVRVMDEQPAWAPPVRCGYLAAWPREPVAQLVAQLAGGPEGALGAHRLGQRLAVADGLLDGGPGPRRRRRRRAAPWPRPAARSPCAAPRPAPRPTGRWWPPPGAGPPRAGPAPGRPARSTGPGSARADASSAGSTRAHVTERHGGGEPGAVEGGAGQRRGGPGRLGLDPVEPVAGHRPAPGVVAGGPGARPAAPRRGRCDRRPARRGTRGRAAPPAPAPQSAAARAASRLQGDGAAEPGRRHPGGRRAGRERRQAAGAPRRRSAPDRAPSESACELRVGRARPAATSRSPPACERLAEGGGRLGVPRAAASAAPRAMAAPAASGFPAPRRRQRAGQQPLQLLGGGGPHPAQRHPLGDRVDDQEGRPGLDGEPLHEGEVARLLGVDVEPGKLPGQLQQARVGEDAGPHEAAGGSPGGPDVDHQRDVAGSGRRPGPGRSRPTRRAATRPRPPPASPPKGPGPP